jgi:hypothetical protein
MKKKKTTQKLYKCDSYYPLGGSFLSIDLIISLFTLILTNVIKHLSKKDSDSQIILGLNICLAFIMVSKVLINIILYFTGKPMLCSSRISVAFSQIISLVILINLIKHKFKQE